MCQLIANVLDLILIPYLVMICMDKNEICEYVYEDGSYRIPFPRPDVPEEKLEE